ncbi:MULTISPECIES: NAD(P)/FAD-dependent oxidoreductase [unclassified Mycolicibacterium]|uniref:NAD(P)/FAD-dependent oxidoreductase n=1 Tax=unclassified Mycolicibacterium TaxID=2636767 RepID=UPI0012DD0565|nr:MULTISPECIES: FAD-dependent oxidoreductase [unclassified Mycolicibacterium]MUL84054.1 FAD-dependent oxidoreductase [Mycolicibacterium sp. CBMA 329]MUL89880.1 FAD-dependent oxidoreductase [Mycolicibacterium sp. CBMA 331]MUM00057.1 FAD-dependent oxidoreductase [Mycolicibacterium sp. CBMA 334]MUM28939.1 FAD-dependent oxidoreductase [Mycolicibacterium sp. CBMA 295]MUM39395.1 FAD-dependent oxidoreductase [Mycolicibacterium sp. CBMA 247]
MSTHDVAIVGGGPAGLTAAAELAHSGLNVVVLERESAAGGIPRHSDHPGYGIRDMKTFISGPTYARRLVNAAIAAGAEIRTSTMVTGWAGDRSLELTSPAGRERLDARAIILATGARERARAARMIPGDRSGGVYTTGQLQNTVHLQHRSVGKRAVVVGAELVSYSAVLTLKHAGCETALMTSEYPSPESYAVFNFAGRTPLMDVEVATTTRVARIIGKGAVQGVEIENTRTGQRRVVDCDTVVFTGDWIPDHELARSAGLDMDPSSLAPVVDTALRTSRKGVFAIGNLLHPVDTADIAALDGRHVAAQVRRYLGGAAAPDTAIRIEAAAPLRWVAPGLLRPGDPAPARQRLLLWSDTLVRIPKVVARQDGKVVGRKTLPWPASPGRVFRVPSSILDAVDHRGGPVSLSLG